MLVAWPSTFLKRYSSTGVFLRILKFFNTSGCLLHVPLNFEKLFRTPFFIENLWEISYFKCKLQDFSQHILVLRVLFKLLHNNEKLPLKVVHLIKIPENCTWKSQFVVTLREASLQVYEKNSFIHTLLCILYSSSQNASRLITCILVVQLRFIWVKFLHAQNGIWRSLQYDFCQISKLDLFSSFSLYECSFKKLNSWSV